MFVSFKVQSMYIIISDEKAVTALLEVLEREKDTEGVVNTTNQSDGKYPIFCNQRNYL
ncbi:unnamed protein product [Protopolystoma xenopodis]|uniref:Uncharacterized protein n=1 Tax=Protopolystoma xenopodis TaxID=117903 RepID=A0A448WVB7_9PLAT|nr:unnamed protein product [Protopolystoma xenopodis]